MFEADRQPDVAFGDAGGELVLRRELRMGGRRGMDGEAARVADIGDVIEELQRVDETPPRLAPAREFEADEPAEAAFEIFLRPLARDAGLQRGMNHLHHFRPLGEPGGDGLRVDAVALDAQRQRLDALQGEEGVERRNRRAEIAQQASRAP